MTAMMVANSFTGGELREVETNDRISTDRYSIDIPVRHADGKVAAPKGSPVRYNQTIADVVV